MSSNFLFIGIILIFFAVVIPHRMTRYFTKKAYEVNQFNLTKKIKGIDLITEMFIYYGIDEFDTNIVKGLFTDHYSFNNNTLNITSQTYNGSSLSCLALACHEVGHAVQFSKSNAWAIFSKKHAHVLKKLALVTGGFLLFYFAYPAVILLYLFCITTAMLLVYQSVVVAVEHDATNRTLKFFNDSKYFDAFALSKVRKVLTASWATYWAFWISAFLQFALGIVFLILASLGILSFSP